MVRILLNGCNGKMGRVISSCVDEREECEIVAGFDLAPEMHCYYPVYTDPQDFKNEADVIIDFSHPSALQPLLQYALKRQLPIVVATTGLSEEQVKLIREASQEIPVFFSANMSIGINLMTELVKKAAAVLGAQFDIEIVEAHHNQKIDAPSGTALMLANAISDTFEEGKTFQYDRHSQRQKRDQKEIGIHAIRGGTIVGEHEVIFAGRDEIVTVSHSARSKEIFAVGAIRAALYLVEKTPGLYDMSKLVAEFD